MSLKSDVAICPHPKEKARKLDSTEVQALLEEAQAPAKPRQKQLANPTRRVYNGLQLQWER